jgi:hypothetical protein
MDLFGNKKTEPWEHYILNNPLTKTQHSFLKNIPEDKNSKDFYTMKPITDQNIIDTFTERNLLLAIQEKLNIDLKLKGLRIVLIDIIGAGHEYYKKNPEKYEIHEDAKEKLLSILIYIDTDTELETGTWLYDKDKKIHTKLNAIPNTGLVFVRQKGVTFHQIPPFSGIPPGKYKRRALLVNYLDIPTRLDVMRNPELTKNWYLRHNPIRLFNYL